MIGANIAKFLNDVAGLVESQEDHGYCGYFQPVLQGRHPYCTGTEERMRIPNNLINMLYKKTRLEDTFGVNMLAVADGKPETVKPAVRFWNIILTSSLKFRPENTRLC